MSYQIASEQLHNHEMVKEFICLWMSCQDWDTVVQRNYFTQAQKSVDMVLVVDTIAWSTSTTSQWEAAPSGGEKIQFF